MMCQFSSGYHPGNIRKRFGRLSRHKPSEALSGKEDVHTWAAANKNAEKLQAVCERKFINSSAFEKPAKPLLSSQHCL